MSLRNAPHDLAAARHRRGVAPNPLDDPLQSNDWQGLAWSLPLLVWLTAGTKPASARKKVRSRTDPTATPSCYTRTPSLTR